MSTERSTHWSVTINNPTSDDYDALDKARSTGWKVEGQVEKGEIGTPHLQLLVRTPQVRFSALKKAFPRAHIEVARNVGALRNYVTKEETKVADLPVQDNKYPSLNRFWEMIWEEFDVQDKDGWDFFNDEEVRFYRDSDQQALKTEPLAFLGEVTARFIKRGYFVEHHVCNPAVRSQWKNFHSEILFRAKHKVLQRRQEIADNVSDTDRQTDSVQNLQIPFAGEDITHANQEDNHSSPSPDDEA